MLTIKRRFQIKMYIFVSCLSVFVVVKENPTQITICGAKNYFYVEYSISLLKNHKMLQERQYVEKNLNRANKVIPSLQICTCN